MKLLFKIDNKNYQNVMTCLRYSEVETEAYEIVLFMINIYRMSDNVYEFIEAMDMHCKALNKIQFASIIAAFIHYWE